MPPIITVAVASALVLASAVCVGADVPAFCVCAGPVWPKPLATQARPLCVSMVGKEDYYQLDLSGHSGRTQDLLRRQSAKQAPCGYGGYDPKTSILQSSPAVHYPEPYGGYELESHVMSLVLSAPINVETDVLSLTPSRSIVDALDRIKRDSFVRLDAAGAQNNIVQTIHCFASSNSVSLPSISWLPTMTAVQAQSKEGTSLVESKVYSHSHNKGAWFG